MGFVTRLRPLAFALLLQACGAGASDGVDYRGDEDAADGGAGSTQPETPSPFDNPVATDDSPAVRAAVGTLPIGGASLLLSADLQTAIASDPERDRVSIVNVFIETPGPTIALQTGDRPGRLVEDAAGRVHVVLRGADQIATLDPEAGQVVQRRDVCREPRGLAYEPAADALHVACATGGLWTLPASGGDPTRRVQVDSDLRDVVAHDGQLWVTRFKSAELLRLDPSGAVVDRQRPNGIVSSRGIRATKVEVPRLEPNGAFRTVVDAGGNVVMLHQRALTEAITIDPAMPASLNGYYGGTCGGIVESAITVFQPDGMRVVTGSLGGTLAVDLAVAETGAPVAEDDDAARDRRAAVAFAGQPRTTPLFDFGGREAFPGVIQEIVTENPPIDAQTHPVVTCEGGTTTSVPAQTVAVAMSPDGAVLLALSRHPAEIHILRKPGGSTDSVFELGGDSVLDTGHEMFHRSPSGGIACASCHLEGGDDGHVWLFDPIGPRRTQAANAGLDGTEPFHWDGDMPDLQALVEEVMVVRMGGLHQSAERVRALSDFMFGLRPPGPLREADDAAALRGRALFESADVGCADCHRGQALTNNESHDVGTGGAFQVPPLAGIGYRAPFLHDGCASTLRARFDADCGGGDAHGHTSQLDDEAIDDLVAYLETL